MSCSTMCGLNYAPHTKTGGSVGVAVILTQGTYFMEVSG
jgi:hypothetical protein